jgi:hypothetical protein
VPDVQNADRADRAGGEVDAFLSAVSGALIAAAKLWVATGAGGRQTFEFGIARWVRQGNGSPFWAVLRTTGQERHTPRDPDLDSDLASRGKRILEFVGPDHTSGDHGAGNHVKIIAADTDGSNLFELGPEDEGGGNGNHFDDRRIFLLCGADGKWRYVGEGPEEGGGNCGWFSCDSSAKFSATFTHSPARPLAIKATTTESNCARGDYDPAIDPGIAVYRDGILDGALPAKFRWPDPPYVISEKDDTVDLVARHVHVSKPDFDEKTDRPALEAIVKGLQVEKPAEKK